MLWFPIRVKKVRKHERPRKVVLTSAKQDDRREESAEFAETWHPERFHGPLLWSMATEHLAHTIHTMAASLTLRWNATRRLLESAPAPGEGERSGDAAAKPLQ